MDKPLPRRGEVVTGNLDNKQLSGQQTEDHVRAHMFPEEQVVDIIHEQLVETKRAHVV